ncbi:MAG TPA: DMT family transporter [Jatrophihabitans sp.]|jgi:drug/metabolite transporter (DMT)-like permease
MTTVDVGRAVPRPARFGPVQGGPAASGEGHGVPVAGLLICLVSAVSFGIAAVLAKESYRAGLGVTSMLTGRFAIAAVVFWVIVLRRRPTLPSARAIGTGVGLGAVGYALQAAFYFGALTKMNAGVVAQLLYIYPALVVMIALARRRESARPRTLIALGCSAAGLVLLLNGGGGGMPLIGVSMALGSAVVYALYITVAAGMPKDFDVYLLSAIVCSSAALSIGTFGAVAGSLHLPTNSSAWFWMSMMALVPTVIAIVAFLAGLRLVGGSAAAILSCVEPVVTAGSAMVVYHEHVGPLQAAGAAAVLGSVVVLSARRRMRPTSPAAAAAGVGLDESCNAAELAGSAKAELSAELAEQRCDLGAERVEEA